jgi:hypothetical protein
MKKARPNYTPKGLDKGVESNWSRENKVFGKKKKRFL